MLADFLVRLATLPWSVPVGMAPRYGHRNAMDEGWKVRHLISPVVSVRMRKLSCISLKRSIKFCEQILVRQKEIYRAKAWTTVRENWDRACWFLFPYFGCFKRHSSQFTNWYCITIAFIFVFNKPRKCAPNRRGSVSNSGIFNTMLLPVGRWTALWASL